MPNITISIDEKLLKFGREYAEKHHTSVNALIRNLLEQTVKSDSTQWLDHAWALMDLRDARSRGKRWKREDLYDVKVFIDTNILVYSLDQSDAGKREKCRGLIKRLTGENSGVISTQVMQEFFVAATAKLGMIRCGQGHPQISGTV